MNAIDFLKGKIADGFIRKVRGNSYSEDLVNGDAVAVIGWSGDMFILKSEILIYLYSCFNNEIF